jgi:RNA polymerase sigma-70 factor (ECF subfamily)
VQGKAQGFPNAEEVETVADPARRFTELYEQHFEFIWRSVRMLGATPDTADDAVQDVFLVAHRRLADFEARSTPRTWLFAIALRVVSDQRRSTRRRKRLLDAAQNMQRAPSLTPFDQAASAESRRALLAALEQLSDEQRAVFVLAELEDMTAPEIASALSVNLNTVYSRLRAARREVATRLRELRELPAGEAP